MWTSVFAGIAATMPQAAPPSTDSTYDLPVRVHLVHSEPTSPLTTSRTPEDVAQLFATANGIWEAAGIQWRVESVHIDSVPADPTYDSVISGDRRSRYELLTAPFPKDDLLDPGWNLFVVSEGGAVFGGFFHPTVGGVVLAERAFEIELTPSGRGGATLAHEFGHSLGLEHRECDGTRNIMANRCWDAARLSSLTSEQLDEARHQAAAGRPVDHEG